jgi:hypothetical protein
MPQAARKNESMHYGTTCVYNYERCGPPMQGVLFPDYAAHNSPLGNCDGAGGCTGGCINVQLTTMGLPFPAGFGIFHTGDPPNPAPVQVGWPARPVVNPSIGRIIEDYRVRFTIVGGTTGAERYAYVPLMEVYPALGTADRIRVYGRGIEVRGVPPADCELIIAFRDSQYRAIGLLGELFVHVLLDSPA